MGGQMAVNMTAVAAKPSIPRDLFNFWRRVVKLPRGRVYHLVLILPEQAERPIEWAFMGDGKRENEG